ncbi:diguanylate cyclase [Chlorogloea sp. CCALA 695]|uniref:diguanylate cyclase n=1 Tax=Chlorogloea sp. CCALA 695 TaxID=2107693 RepID=UPI000D04D4C5|nr:diguanylate cyclase [Chlorogloea sp. CCALA 695]PSB35043.1 GGDEF domain-containing protein [Chlorogloea sp. CCALA 695]
MTLPSLHKLSVKTRLAIAMGAMFVPLVVLAGGALFYFERGINAFEKTENQYLEVLFPVANLESLILENSSPVKDYMTNGDYAAQTRFLRSSQKIERTFALLLAVPSNLPEKKILIQASQKQWQQALVVGKTVFAYHHPATNPRAVQAAEGFYKRNSQAVSSLDQLYKIFTHIQSAENLNQAGNVKRKVRAIVVVAFLLGTAVAVVTSTIVIRSIVQPLSVLEKGVAHLGNGDFSHRINLTNQDELGQLAVAFNLMIGKLEQSQTELKNLATLDELTGVYNRREFNLQLKNELERSGRYDHCFTLLLLDIDFFKKLNDTYGHQAGDLALRSIAALLKQEFRDLDRVSRYGGEEFIVILPETSSATAYSVAERIRQLISTYALSIDENQTVNVTISGGLATFPEDGVEAKSLIHCADQALYAAKYSGRNKIIVYDSLTVKKIS